MTTEIRDTGLISSLPAFALRMDADGCIEVVSDALLERLHFSREEMLGRRPEEFATEASRERIRQEHMPR